MAYEFSSLKQKIKEKEEWLKKEFGGVRAGRANPSLLDGVKVEVYGSLMPIVQVGTVLTEDARTLRISPWDASNVKSIEKAITTANLGVSVAVDDKGVRIFFPELTSERRESIVKIAKEKLEHVRIGLRTLRDEIWKDIQAKEKEGGMGEDEKFRLKDEMQKYIDAANKVFEELYARKEKEIMEK